MNVRYGDVGEFFVCVVLFDVGGLDVGGFGFDFGGYFEVVEDVYDVWWYLDFCVDEVEVGGSFVDGDVFEVFFGEGEGGV